MTRMRMRPSFLFSIPFWLQGCVTAAGTFEPLGPDHPASPRASELPITDPSAFLRTLEGGGAADSSGGSMHLGAFSCPMHPEISSDDPGRCPTCGMQLVAREGAELPRGEHSHGD